MHESGSEWGSLYNQRPGVSRVFEDTPMILRLVSDGLQLRSPHQDIQWRNSPPTALMARP
jgi:hypothetical protein